VSRPCSRATLVLAVAAASAVGWGQHPQEPFHGEVEVRRIVTEVRVVDHDGSPVAGLDPNDFEVTVDGQPVVVESVDWVVESETVQRPVSGAAQQPGPRHEPDGRGLPPPRGRLIVLLYQTDMHYSRISGLMRTDGHVIDFVTGLPASDRVAVAVMGSHLQLHADFTDDFEGLARQLTAPDVLERRSVSDDGRWPSLARHFDDQRARRATTISEALGVIGEALTPIPGTKAVVLVGWGAGTFRAHSGVVRLGPDYDRALRSLASAHASVFTFDITSADRHSLEVGLEQLAHDTGGFYIKTHLFPGIAIDKLVRTLTGHYILTLIPPDKELGEEFKVRVRVDIPGVEILSRRLQFTDS
jgi:VWFA-related protein